MKKNFLDLQQWQRDLLVSIGVDFYTEDPVGIKYIIDNEVNQCDIYDMVEHLFIEDNKLFNESDLTLKDWYNRWNGSSNGLSDTLVLYEKDSSIQKEYKLSLHHLEQMESIKNTLLGSTSLEEVDQKILTIKSETILVDHNDIYQDTNYVSFFLELEPNFLLRYEVSSKTNFEFDRSMFTLETNNPSEKTIFVGESWKDQNSNIKVPTDSFNRKNK